MTKIKKWFLDGFYLSLMPYKMIWSTIKNCIYFKQKSNEPEIETDNFFYERFLRRK